jgi:hypothetical protein
MAFQCGITNNGCDSKNGTIGIEYTIPDPPYVRYRYSGTDWQTVISGTSFTTELTLPPFTGGQCLNVRYKVIGTVTERKTSSRTQEFLGNTTWHFNHYLGISGPYKNITNPTIGSLRGGNDRLSIAIQRNNSTISDVATTSNFTGANPLIGNGTITAINIQLRREDNLSECGDLPSTCIFKIYNANNQIIYTETRSVCPEAQTMPSVYGSNKGSFNIDNDSGKVLKIVNSEASNIKSTTIQLNNGIIKKLSSPLGSALYPQVCWDCEEGKKCPPNTCEVDCGDRTCCYNSLGISVYEFRN